MNVFERTLRDYAALYERENTDNELERSIVWACAELTRLREMEMRVEDVVGITNLLRRMTQDGLGYSAQAAHISAYLRGGKGWTR